ncbi:hypothetical protein AYR66_14525 [Noviherbaspirillum denitrificans]|uniref:Histidine phosphatase family protein n=2 Tax=Noviherbaspirillum denitrificans TaxID=1968433 RepID=A0A254TK32_9BURK|nr:hypothetical protein AYR66_14525 [Noviherbaspirillum denitrificans]
MVWEQLRTGGYILLMRHAQTDAGVGDPPGFTLGDCRTQRNLSSEGRVQARRTGEMFRNRGIAVGEVRTSAWCRCVDTATLAFDNAVVWPVLNSFFDNPERRERQTGELKDYIRGYRSRANLVLVTHQVNITALTGETVAAGEIVVLKPGEPGAVVGKLKVP